MRIDGYNAVGQPNNDPAPQGAKPVAPRPEKAPVPEAPRQTGDTVQISQAALQASRAQEIADMARTLEEIRPEMVQYARDFLAAGMQNDQAVLEQTADKLAQTFGL